LPVDFDADAVVAVVLDAVVVCVDCVVDVLADAAVEDVLLEPPHAPSRSAIGRAARNRFRELTVAA
jgi:hypothetical protein